MVTTTADGLPPAATYYDLLGRAVRTRGTAFGDRVVFQDTEYDSLGRVARTSAPYYWSESPSLWRVPGYDAAGRVITVTPPDGITADSVSTAACVLGAEQARAVFGLDRRLRLFIRTD